MKGRSSLNLLDVKVGVHERCSIRILKKSVHSEIWQGPSIPKKNSQLSRIGPFERNEIYPDCLAPLLHRR